MPYDIITEIPEDKKSKRQTLKMYKRMLLAKKIKLKLKADKINITTFALELDRKPSEISKWLSGNHNFTIDTLLEIEDQLKINLLNIDLPFKDVINGSSGKEMSFMDETQESDNNSEFPII